MRVTMPLNVRQLSTGEQAVVLLTKHGDSDGDDVKHP